MADFTTTEVANFWLLHTVNSYLPELKHIWKVRRGHPDVLYRAMLRLAGALTTFTMNQSVRDFPDYDHDNLGESFTALDLRIRDLLETVLPSKCVTIPLELKEKLVWSGKRFRRALPERLAVHTVGKCEHPSGRADRKIPATRQTFLPQRNQPTGAKFAARSGVASPAVATFGGPDQTRQPILQPGSKRAYLGWTGAGTRRQRFRAQRDQ